MDSGFDHNDDDNHTRHPSGDNEGNSGGSVIGSWVLFILFVCVFAYANG